MNDIPHDSPPPVRAIPSAWQAVAVRAVQRGPAQAESCARVVEEIFRDDFDPEVVADAAQLAAWLRAMARRSRVRRRN